MLVAASVVVSRADIPELDATFDNSSSVTAGTANYNPPPIGLRYDSGTAQSQSYGWASVDATANAASGSAFVTWAWDATETNGMAFSFTMDLFPQAVTNATAISFDLMIDPSSTPGTGSAADYGFLQVITRDNGYTWNLITNFGVAGEGLLVAAGGATGVWAHVYIPLPNPTNAAIRALTFQDYNDGYRQIIGPEKIYLDNLTIYKAGIIVPPTNYLTSAIGPKGLIVVSTTNATVNTGQAQYERQGIETVSSQTNGLYSWVDGGNQTTYAMTITNFPSATYSNYLAYMWLVPFFTTEPTSPDEDYSPASVVVVHVTVNSAGIGLGSILAKESIPNSNPLSLVTVTNALPLGPLGTWTLAANGVTLTLTSPSGDTASTNLASSSAFFDPLAVYVGAMANSTNNIGQKVVFSGFQIVSNGVTTLTDNFTSASLNTNKWMVQAEDPTGVYQVPVNAALLMSWSLPAAGFRITASTNLGVSSSWHSAGLLTFTTGGRGGAFIPSDWLTTNTFYRLQDP
jgi:hypothetical protein